MFCHTDPPVVVGCGYTVPWSRRQPCTALLGSGAAHTAEAGHYLHSAKDGSEYKALVQVRAACLAPHMPRWPQAGPAHRCQPPYLQAQSFCLSWAELGTLTEAPRACCRMIYPRARTHCPPPWTLQGPSSSPGIPSSAWRQAWTAGEPHSAPHTGGPSSAMPAGKPVHRSPWESKTSGLAAAIPNSTGHAQRAARVLTVWSPSSAQRRSALRMGQFWVHPALRLARGGEYYRVRIATG